MRYRSCVSTIGVLSALSLSGCAVHSTGGAQHPYNPEAFNFYNDGDEIYLAIDVRPYRMGDRSEDLVPFQVAIVNKSLERLDVAREAIVVEGENGRTLPLATYDEYRMGYGRASIDDRAGLPFRETLLGRFPAPPFTYRDLEFFPPRTAAFSPRSTISLRRGEAGLGWIYFRLGQLRPKPDGRYTLLVRAKGRDPWVLEFPAND